MLRKAKVDGKYCTSRRVNPRAMAGKWQKWRFFFLSRPRTKAKRRPSFLQLRLRLLHLWLQQPRSRSRPMHFQHLWSETSRRDPLPLRRCLYQHSAMNFSGDRLLRLKKPCLQERQPRPGLLRESRGPSPILCQTRMCQESRRLMLRFECLLGHT